MLCFQKGKKLCNSDIVEKEYESLARFILIFFVLMSTTSCAIGKMSTFYGPEDSFCEVGGVTISVNMANAFDWNTSGGVHPQGFNFKIKFPKEMVSDISNISGEYCYGTGKIFCTSEKHKLEIVKSGRSPGSPDMNLFKIFVKPADHIEIVKGQPRLTEGNYKIWLKFDYNNIEFNSVVQVYVGYYSKVEFLLPGCLFWTIGVLTTPLRL